jgi:CheY-like chemotaxis protein
VKTASGGVRVRFFAWDARITRRPKGEGRAARMNPKHLEEKALYFGMIDPAAGVMLSRAVNRMRTSIVAKKILVVDDDRAVRIMLDEFFTSRTYKVLTAASGEEALTLAEREEPEVILLDAIMPGINGLETCQRLKAEEKTRWIPIIMMTGFGIVPGEANAVGAEDLVFKPFSLADLLRRVSAIGKVRHLENRIERLMAYREELDRNLSR